MPSKRTPYFIDFFKETVFAQIILIIIFIAVVWFFDWSFLRFSSFDLLASGKATLTIENGGSSRIFEGEIIEGMTIVDALNASAQAGGLGFEYLISATGDTYIKTINGQDASQLTLRFYVNNKEVDPVDLNRRILKSGDKIMVQINN